MQGNEKAASQKDAIAKKILEKAYELFEEKGIDGVSMHQIAKAAGIGQGTLYRRYAHKGELCLELMLEIADKNCEKIERYLEENQNEPISVRLEKALEYSLDFIEEQSKWLSAITAPNCDDNLTIIYRSPIYTSRHAIFRGLLEEIPGKQLDASYVSDLIMAGIAPNLYQFLRDERGYTIDQIRENLFQAVLRPLLIK